MIVATIAGNLGRDAEMRNAGGQDLASFSIASTSKVKGEKNTTWVDCSLWGKRGAALARHLSKGTRVVVTGELSTREYNGKTYLQCRVDQLELMGGGQREQQPSRQPGDEDYGGDDEIPFS